MTTGVRNLRRVEAFALLSALGAAAGLLYRFPPEQAHFYPLCPIFTYTGLLCPGCGATHALSALVHGHLLTALHWNPLLILLLPALALYLALAVTRGRWPTLKPSLINGFLVVTVLFTVFRNIT